MMNKRIRSMVDEIFSEMKMTAENLALRDELMANAQARYEDSVAQGKSEEEAFVEVAASLEDVCGLLEEMKRMDEQQSGDAPQEETVPELKTGTEPEDAGETADEEAGKDAGEHAGEAPQTDLGMRDAQKAAEEAIDKFAGEDGELVFDFGANKEAAPQETEQEPQASDTPENDLEDAMEEARREAERATREAAGEADGEDAQEPAEETAPETDGETAQEPLADSEPDEEAFSRAVDEMTREAEEVIHQAAKAARDAAEGAAEYVVRDAGEPVSGRQTFPAAGLHKIDIQLDADDVEIVPADGTQVETLWEAQSADSEPVVTMSGHTLTIRRKNPDVFKTFFSVFQKAGGRITVRVPRGYAAGYAITTTSGDVRIGELDLDDVKVTTTSGSVRVEPDAKTRAGDIAVTTVSGHATVSACADTIGVTTVSGSQFISCDAHKVDVNVVSGRVHVEGACDEWEVSAVSSDVELLCTVAPTKKVQISSVHGDVRLALPGDIRGFVAESSGALGCEIINEFGPNRYGTCGLPIRMETMRGKLIITRL